MPWKRVGECPPERCQGDCCKQIGLWYDDTPETRAFLGQLQARGVRVKDVEGKFLVGLDQRCQHLTRKGKCGIYGQTSRPVFCAEWPVEPSQLLLHPRCGFSFEWVEEQVPIGAKHSG